MKIGILSDVHRKVDLLQSALDNFKQYNLDYIICAGDLEIENNLQLLKSMDIPYYCVFGNNDLGLFNLKDKYNIFKEPYYFKIERLNFKLMHLPFYLSADSDIVIYGHTHLQDISYKNGTLFLNPGEICAREKPQSTYMILEILDNKYIITTYINDFNIITTKRIEYER